MTAAPFVQDLPDLAAYRREFAAAGVALPLPDVPSAESGLLRRLPPPPPGRTGWPWTTETPPETMADAPSFSVIVVSYQQGEYLEEALRSVLLQNYPRLQLIVMDGGSTDATSGVLAKYRPWLSHARSARDRGQAHAVNLGFALADGELRGWLNSDDFQLPGALFRIARARRATGADFFYGDALALDETRGIARHTTASIPLDRYLKFPGIVFSHASYWTAASQRPLWEAQQCAVDYELWIRLLPGLRRRHVPWPLGVIRIHGAAKSHSPLYTARWAEDAARNGLAHPGLYREGLRSRLLAREFRWREQWTRRWRDRGLAARLEDLRRECGWERRPLSG